MTYKDKGKRRFIDPGPVQRSDKDVQPSMMMKLGVLEFRIEKLEKCQSNSAELSCKLSQQEVAISDLQREKGELASQLSTIQMELQSKADTILTMKQREEEVKHSFKCLICGNIVFPCVVSPCCNIVVGCQQCIQKWLSANDNCPHCRATMTIEACKVIPKLRSLDSVFCASPEIVIDD